MSRAASADPAQVPPELRKRFWLLVGVFNLALLALAVGVLLAVFRGRLVVGAGLVVVGVASFGYGWHRYRRARNRPPGAK